MFLLAYLLVCAGVELLQASADPPPAPSLLLVPVRPVYAGEHATLTCFAPRESPVRGFNFFKDGHALFSVHKSQPNVTHHLNSNNHTAMGAYTCAYWIEVSERQVNSTESPVVSFVLKDAISAPFITLTPQYPVYVRGESVNISCTAPAGLKVKGFQIYNKGHVVYEAITEQDRATYEISTSDPEAAGLYSCVYWKESPSGDIPSTDSDTVVISVTDQLFPPALSLDPLDGLSVDDKNLTLTCSTSAFYENLTFYFRFEEGRTHSLSPHLNDSKVQVSVPAILKTERQTKNYGCYYEALIEGRILRSEMTAIRITLASFWIRPLAVGGAFILANTLIFVSFRFCS